MKKVCLSIILCTAVIFSVGCSSGCASKISISDYDFSTVDSISIQDGHTGQKVEITDTEKLNEIVAYLKEVKGKNVESSKGYYGGCYGVACMSGDETVFSIGFTDDEAFNNGQSYAISGEEIYPDRWYLDGLTTAEVSEFFKVYFEE